MTLPATRTIGAGNQVTLVGDINDIAAEVAAHKALTTTAHGNLLPLGDDLYGSILTTGITTIRRTSDLSTAAASGTGFIGLTYFRSPAAFTAANMAMITGFTPAAATPTLCKMGLYSVNPTTGELTRIAATANDTALFSVANTRYTRAFVTPVALTVGQLLAAAVVVVSGAATPTLVGCLTAGLSPLILTAPPRMNGVIAGTDLDTPLAGGGIASSNNRFYAEITP